MTLLYEEEGISICSEPFMAISDLPLGHQNGARRNLGPGETLSCFSAPWQEYGEAQIRTGYAVVSAGAVVRHWTRRIDNAAT